MSQRWRRGKGRKGGEGRSFLEGNTYLSKEGPSEKKKKNSEDQQGRMTKKGLRVKGPKRQTAIPSGPCQKTNKADGRFAAK